MTRYWIGFAFGRVRDGVVTMTHDEWQRMCVDAGSDPDADVSTARLCGFRIEVV